MVMAGCMWEPTKGWRGIIEKLIVKMADRAIHSYAVQSSEELTLFPDTWGVSPAKIRLCPYFFSVSKRVDLTTPAPPADHVFAGGNSHRAYDSLLEAARYFPERHFILATHLLREHPNLPPNVIAGPITPEDYTNLTRSAAAVVVPIRPGLRRAAGQQTYLGAMWFGKPTIVTDTLGVHDHVQDGETGFIVDGSVESYIRVLGWIFDPANHEQVVRLGRAAHEVVSRQFTIENYVTGLLAVLDEVIREQQSSL
jgi:glycosyltransferase involved in cell wall biosynthesis